MNPNNAPLVSVIMPCYNASSFLEEAISSILNQTYTNFEFLIFNDASTDNSWDIIEKYANQDNRIKAYNHTTNIGYVDHLNQGIKIAQGKYIARMDADDISLSFRFEKQVEFLETNPTIGVCGSQYECIGTLGGFAQLPLTDLEIKVRFLHHTAIQHPSVMMRKNILDIHHLNYEKSRMPSEDFHLWVQMGKHSKLANIPDYLIKYRMHSNNISIKAHPGNELYQVFVNTQKDYYKYLFSNVNFNEEDYTFLHEFFTNKLSKNLNNLEKTPTFIHKIATSYNNDYIDKNELLNHLYESYYYYCTTSTHLGWTVVKNYFKTCKKRASLHLELKLIIKALFKIKINE